MTGIFKILSILFLLGMFLVSNGQNPELTIQNGHSAPVTHIAFSSDGKYIATAGDDNIIILWDFRLGKQIKILKGHTLKINELKFINKGYDLFSCGSDGQIIYWDIYSGKPRQVINMGAPVMSFDISSDNTELAAAGGFGSIKCWSITDSLVFRRSIKIWPETDSLKLMQLIVKNNHLNWSRNVNKKFISAFQNMYSPTTAGCFVVYGRNMNEFIVFRGIRLFNKADLIANFDVALVTADGNISKTWNRKTMKMYHRNNDRYIYFTSISSTLSKLDLEKGKIIYNRTGDLLKYEFTCISVNSNDSLLASVSNEGNIFMWKTGGKYCRIFSGKGTAYTSVAFHPVYSNLAVTGNISGDVSILDVRTGKVVRKLESGIFPLNNLAVSPSGNAIAISGSDNIISVFDLNGRVTISGFQGNNKKISGLYFITDSLLVSAGGDNLVNFYSFGNEGKTSLKGNSNPMLANSIIDLPLISLFISSVTTYGYASAYLRGSIESLDAVSVSSDNKLIATGGSGFRNGMLTTMFQPRIFPIHIIDVSQKKKINKIPAHYGTINDLAFNRNSSILASCGYDNKAGAAVIEKSNKANIVTENMLNMISATNFSTGAKKMNKAALINSYNCVKIWKPGEKMPIATFEMPNEIRSVLFSPINDTMVISDSRENIVMFDFKKQKAEKMVRGSGPVFFTSGGNIMFYQDSSYSLVQYDTEAKKEIIRYTGHNDSLTSAVITPDRKHIITTSLDGSMKIWDAATGKEKATVFSMNGSDFIIKTPDYYYYASKNAKKEIGFTFGIKFYPFEQFDLQYNRPDIVLERLGMAPPDMIRALNLAYHKRLQKSGFNEDMFSNDFHLPEMKITDADGIPVSTIIPDLTLDVKATDSKYKLDRVNVWINDVAVYGSNGLSLREKNSSEFSGKIKVKLSRGINRIRVSCMNEKGVESLRETAEIVYSPDGSEKPDLHIIVIGASEYADKDWNLNYAAKDAQDVADLFATRKNDYNKINTTLLLNRDVTRENILKLRQGLMSTNVDDKVLVFYAGHGLLDENLDYYLATYNTDFKKPSVNGLSYNELNSLLDSIPAREKLLLIDACHSGEVDKEETVIADANQSKENDVVFRGARPRGYQSNSNISYNNSFELMKEMFSDLRKGTGAMVISSAGGGEFAFEGSQWKNGVFTWSLREGLISEKADRNKDGIITVSELQNHILNNVTKLTGGKQKPTMRQENIENDFVIWKKD